MSTVDPTEARFPHVAGGAGHYESFYLKACHPHEPLGVWIRYTVHKRPGAAPTGSLWFTLFDAAAGGPRAQKVTVAAPRAGGGEWLGVGEAAIGPARASAPWRGSRGSCASTAPRRRCSTCRATGCTALGCRAPSC